MASYSTLSIAAKYEKDIQDMREQVSRIMSMMQQNPQLAYIKPEALTTKKVEIATQGHSN